MNKLKKYPLLISYVISSYIVFILFMWNDIYDPPSKKLLLLMFSPLSLPILLYPALLIYCMTPKPRLHVDVNWLFWLLFTLISLTAILYVLASKFLTKRLN